MRQKFLPTTRKNDNSILDYSFDTGMVYPPEGLFYIEMDQAPPGKLGLKAAIVWSVERGVLVERRFIPFLLPSIAGIVMYSVCNKVDIWHKCCAGAGQAL